MQKKNTISQYHRGRESTHNGGGVERKEKKIEGGNFIFEANSQKRESRERGEQAAARRRALTQKWGKNGERREREGEKKKKVYCANVRKASGNRGVVAPKKRYHLHLDQPKDRGEDWPETIGGKGHSTD